MLSAAQLLQDRQSIGNLNFEINHPLESLSGVVSGILLPARKGKLGLSPQQTEDLALYTMQTTQGITTADELETLINNLDEELSAKVQQLL